MKLYAGLEVVVIDDPKQLEPYGSQLAAGCRGTLFSGQPAGQIGGFNFFEVLIYSTAYAVREDHFVPWVGEEAREENEDERWRRAAQDAWQRIHDVKTRR